MLFIKKDKNILAFTLIELLAVIVILAVVATISTLIILGVVEDAKKGSLKVTAYSLMDGALSTVMKQEIIGEKMYIIENKSFVGDGIDIRESLPKNGQISVNEELKTAVAITDGKWCARKDYEEKEVTISEYVNAYDCRIEIIIPTPKLCFDFDISTRKIEGYYDYEDDDSNNPACPKDVVIPDEIDGVSVEIIEKWAFEEKQLTSLRIGKNVITIGKGAFVNNQIKSVIIPNSVTSIGDYSFEGNDMENLMTEL